MRSSPSAADLPFDRPFAHRGLHGPGVVENSRAAFRAAIAADYGIELDVRLARCGTPMVFHDDGLERLTGHSGRIARRSADALAPIRLAGTDEPIPRLAEILALIAGRVPLLIEVKAEKRRAIAAARAVAAAIAGYAGPLCVMSFDPQIPRWFRRHRPEQPRGLVVSEGDRRGRWPRMLAYRLSHPHFIACDIRDLPSPLSRHAGARGLPVLSWTVRTADERARAARHARQIIFEDAP